MEDIKTIREKHELSRSQFCKLLNIPVRTVEDWEHGKRKCPVYVIELIKFRLEKEFE